MLFFRRAESVRATAPTQAAQPTANRRAHRRYGVSQALQCPLGEVLDLSQTGMRLRGKHKPPAGQLLQLTLHWGHEHVAVNGRVRRVVRRGLCKFEVGIQFVGLTDAHRRILESLGRFGFVKHDSPDNAQKPRGSRPLLKASAAIPDLYAVLGVKPDATIEDLRHAHRTRARELHPDMHPDRDTSREFQAVHDAYLLLKDANRREEYDAMRKAGVSMKFEAA